MLIIYVDDALVAANSMNVIEKAIEQLRKAFSVKDLGEQKKFLGCNITRDRTNKTITISQQPYVMKTPAKYGMEFCAGSTSLKITSREEITSPW
jgi:Reverse transcriptase (RNA-dependent DNA polymerase)